MPRVFTADLTHLFGEKPRDTTSIVRLFPEVRRKIGGSYGGHELISVSLIWRRIFFVRQGGGFRQRSLAKKRQAKW
jgi:hypothetical protein